MKEFNYMIFMRKWELMDFFRYSRFYVRCPRIAFNGDVAGLNVDRSKAQALFGNINPIENGLEGFLVHIKVSKPISDSRPIHIGDAVAIYALDDLSLRVGLQFYPAVRLNAPLGGAFKEEYELSRTRAAAMDALDGVVNIKEIFGFNENRVFSDRKAKLIGGVEVLKRYIELGMASDQPSGEDNVWTYLLRYERHQNYPTKMRGYFLDMLHVLANFKAKRSIDESVIDRDKEMFGEEHLAAGISVLSDSNYNELLDICLKSKSCKDILNKELRVFVPAAPIFLMLGDVFREGMDNRSEYGGMKLREFVECVKKNFSNTSKYAEALYLLGLKLGRESTRSAAYQVGRLNIIEK